jgi:rfaE bifunctional protein nucleotidyltransferase chain/domain
MDVITSPAYRLADLVERVHQIRAAGERVALCHGCFDILHYGHLLHLTEARTFADRLVVTVTPDRFVNKGTGRPIYTEVQRAEMLAALRVVDAVAVNEWPTAAKAIRALRPNFFVKGIDYASEAANHAGLAAEREAAGAVDAVLVMTGTPKWSSSALVAAGSLGRGPTHRPPEPDPHLKVP